MSVPARALENNASDDDHHLASAFTQGDISAFTKIVERHRAHMLAVARKYANCEEAAHDIVQEAFLKASVRMHTFRAEAKLGTWLQRLVMNSGYDFVHHRLRREIPTLDEERIPHDVNVNLSIDPFHNEHDRLLLEDLLKVCTPEQQEALILIDIAGFSIEYVALRQRVAPGTVKSRRARAKKVLREEYFAPRRRSVKRSLKR